MNMKLLRILRLIPGRDIAVDPYLDLLRWIGGAGLVGIDAAVAKQGPVEARRAFTAVAGRRVEAHDILLLVLSEGGKRGKGGRGGGRIGTGVDTKRGVLWMRRFHPPPHALLHRRCRRPARAEPNGNPSDPVTCDLFGVVDLLTSSTIRFVKKGHTLRGIPVATTVVPTPIIPRLHGGVVRASTCRPTAVSPSGGAPAGVVPTFWVCLSSFTDC